MLLETTQHGHLTKLLLLEQHVQTLDRHTTLLLVEQPLVLEVVQFILVVAKLKVVLVMLHGLILVL